MIEQYVFWGSVALLILGVLQAYIYKSIGEKVNEDTRTPKELYAEAIASTLPGGVNIIEYKGKFNDRLIHHPKFLTKRQLLERFERYKYYYPSQTVLEELVILQSEMEVRGIEYELD